MVQEQSGSSAEVIEPPYSMDDVHKYPPAPPALAASLCEAETGVLQRNRPANVEEDDERPTEVTSREVMRTPSPTPTEAYALDHKTRMCNWGVIFNPRTYKNKRKAWILFVTVCILAFVTVFLVFQRRIVDVLRPFAHWVHDAPAGWLIPIGVMFILSFPPLFGHEIIAILCGDVWGVWIGFGIVAAGTLVGELGNFYAFKWCCTSRGKRMEERQLTYALYAQVVREGGFWIPAIMRFSAIPGHFLTAVFSTCGMSVWMFTASAALSLPKQLAIVYIGQTQSGSGKTNTVQTVVKVIVVLVTGAMTYLTMQYINKKMDEVKREVIYARRKARQAKVIVDSAVMSLSKDNHDEAESRLAKGTASVKSKRDPGFIDAKASASGVDPHASNVGVILEQTRRAQSPPVAEVRQTYLEPDLGLVTLPMRAQTNARPRASEIEDSQHGQSAPTIRAAEQHYRDPRVSLSAANVGDDECADRDGTDMLAVDRLNEASVVYKEGR